MTVAKYTIYHDICYLLYTLVLTLHPSILKTKKKCFSLYVRIFSSLNGISFLLVPTYFGSYSHKTHFSCINKETVWLEK